MVLLPGVCSCRRLLLWHACVYASMCPCARYRARRDCGEGGMSCWEERMHRRFSLTALRPFGVLFVGAVAPPARFSLVSVVSHVRTNVRDALLRNPPLSKTWARNTFPNSDYRVFRAQTPPQHYDAKSRFVSFLWSTRLREGGPVAALFLCGKGAEPQSWADHLTRPPLGRDARGGVVFSFEFSAEHGRRRF